MHTNARLAALGVLAAFLAGCGGGAHGIAALPATAGSGTPGAAASKGKGKGTATIAIKIPAKQGMASSQRKAQYVSPATTQMTIDIEQSGASIAGYPQTVGLTPTSSGCTSTLASTLCQLSVVLAPGDYTTSVSLGDGTNTLSSTQSFPFTIVAGASNSIALTLGGIATSLAVIPTTPIRMRGTNNTFAVYGNHPVTFQAVPVDADGNFIIGPGSPTASVSLGSTVNASLSTPAPSNPTQWTLNPNYTASDPTVPATTTLSVSATPVPYSSGSTVSNSVALSIYQPWVYAVDRTTSSVNVYDEDGNAITAGITAFTGSAVGVYTNGIAYHDGHLYLTLGYGHNGYIGVYSLFGGAALSTVGSAQIPALGTPFYLQSIAYDPHNQEFYVGDSGSTGVLQSYDAGLTTNIVSTTDVPTYGVVYVPLTQQLVYVSAYGGLVLCSESLSCSSFGGTTLNDTGIDWDPYAQLLGVNAFSSSGQVNLVDLSGNVKSTFGSGQGRALAFDLYSGNWYRAAGGAGMQVFSESGTQLAPSGTFSGIASSDNVGGIVVVP